MLPDEGRADRGAATTDGRPRSEGLQRVVATRRGRLPKMNNIDIYMYGIDMKKRVFVVILCKLQNHDL